MVSNLRFRLKKPIGAYVYILLDSGLNPIYVGSGVKGRYHQSSSIHNAPYCILLMNNLTRSSAFIHELELICYLRKHYKLNNIQHMGKEVPEGIAVSAYKEIRPLLKELALKQTINKVINNSRRHLDKLIQSKNDIDLTTKHYVKRLYQKPLLQINNCNHVSINIEPK